jgi:hypothetical protein
VEAAPRLDGRADDDELGTTLGGDARDLLAETARACSDDLPAHADPVRARHRGGRLEPLLEAAELAVHVRVQRQFSLDEKRRDEDDARAAVGREPAGKVERVLRLFPVEQRHDDRAIGDRSRPAREAPGAAVEQPDVGPPHRSSWYGTEARMTFGSTSSSRFT